ILALVIPDAAYAISHFSSSISIYPKAIFSYKPLPLRPAECLPHCPPLAGDCVATVKEIENINVL
ncbi:MAG: hypothetical protein L7F78_15905, partial [Syntrophales bacterium LBB04]|nr:hypothetical protein [Syntrophales bacterium LBB04]